MKNQSVSFTAFSDTPVDIVLAFKNWPGLTKIKTTKRLSLERFYCGTKSAGNLVYVWELFDSTFHVLAHMAPDGRIVKGSPYNAAWFKKLGK